LRNSERGDGIHADERSLTVLRTTDDAAWREALSEVAEHDFHHMAGYHRVAEQRGEGSAALFVYRSAGHTIALPLLLRAVDSTDPGGPRDATSVYGYAGPVASHREIPVAVIDSFQRALREELERRHVVAVFSRLHPLIDQRELLAGLGEIRSIGLTVSVDLEQSLDEQWAGYSKKCRRIIRRAVDAGVVCTPDYAGVHRGEWAAMYAATMERVGAASTYRYDEGYFDLLLTELGSVLHLFVASIGSTVVAAGLYSLCRGITQAHLGAFRAEYAAISPVRLLDDTARRWAAASGARVFHLGGGVGGREDSLFQYKAGFSDRRHEFATWQWVVDENTYDRLCRERDGQAGSREVDSAYFPAYRRAVETAL
jgi:hypothetical protein